MVKLQFRMILTSMSLSDEHNCSNTNILTIGRSSVFQSVEKFRNLRSPFLANTSDVHHRNKSYDDNDDDDDDRMTILGVNL